MSPFAGGRQTGISFSEVSWPRAGMACAGHVWLLLPLPPSLDETCPTKWRLCSQPLERTGNRNAWVLGLRCMILLANWGTPLHISLNNGNQHHPTSLKARLRRQRNVRVSTLLPDPLWPLFRLWQGFGVRESSLSSQPTSIAAGRHRQYYLPSRIVGIK